MLNSERERKFFFCMAMAMCRLFSSSISHALIDLSMVVSIEETMRIQLSCSVPFSLIFFFFFLLEEEEEKKR